MVAVRHHVPRVVAVMVAFATALVLFPAAPVQARHNEVLHSSWDQTPNIDVQNLDGPHVMAAQALLNRFGYHSFTNCLQSWGYRVTGYWSSCDEVAMDRYSRLHDVGAFEYVYRQHWLNLQEGDSWTYENHVHSTNHPSGKLACLDPDSWFPPANRTENTTTCRFGGPDLGHPRSYTQLAKWHYGYDRWMFYDYTNNRWIWV